MPRKKRGNLIKKIDSIKSKKPQEIIISSEETIIVKNLTHNWQWNKKNFLYFFDLKMQENLQFLEELRNKITQKFLEQISEKKDIVEKEIKQIQDKTIELVLFSFLFSEKNSLYVQKYKPLKQQHLFNKAQSNNFETFFLDFLKRNKKAEKIRNIKMLNEGYDDSYFNSNSGLCFDKVDDPYLNEYRKKSGIIINGSNSSGKKTLLQTFCYNNNIEIEKIDFAQFQSISSIIKKYQLAVHMKDVKINMLSESSQSFFGITSNNFQKSKTQGSKTQKQNTKNNQNIQSFFKTKDNIKVGKKRTYNGPNLVLKKQRIQIKPQKITLDDVMGVSDSESKDDIFLEDQATFDT